MSTSGSISDAVDGLGRLDIAPTDHSPLRDPNYVHKPSATPIVNFPLPRELRDEIYGYLLDATQVDETATKSESKVTDYAQHVGDFYATYIRTFKFEGAILAANKSFNEEATTYLYGRNFFVKVNYDLPAFELMRTMARLPLVRMLYRGRACVTHHCLTIDLAWQNAPHAPTIAAMEFKTDFAPDRGSFLMLLSDLPKLSDMLRYLCGMRLPACATVVTSARAKRLALHRPTARQVPSVKVRSHITKYITLSETQQSTILQNLQRITGAGYIMLIGGIGDCAARQRVLDSAGPSIIWPVAMLKQVAADGRSCMQRVDELALAGYFAPAGLEYALLSKLTNDHEAINDILQCVKEPGHHELLAAMLLMSGLKIDLSLALADVQMRQKRSDFAMGTLQELEPYLPKLPAMQYARALYLQALALLTVYTPPKLADISMACQLLERVKEIAPDQLTHAHGDLDIARHLLVASFESATIPGSALAKLDQLSIRKLPFVPYNSEKDTPDGHRPTNSEEDMIDWQDVQQLKELKGPEKKFIQAFQSKRGLNLTTFD